MEIATQTDEQTSYPLGVALVDCPRRQFSLASIAHFEALYFQSQHKPADEIREKYKTVRVLLERTLVAKQLSYGTRAPEEQLTPDESALTYLWMADILANGLDGNSNILRAQELCKKLIKVYPHVLKERKLNQEVCYVAHAPDLLSYVQELYAKIATPRSFDELDSPHEAPF